MACPRCYHAIRAAGKVLEEISALEPHELTPGTDWLAVADQLIALSNHLETLHQEQQTQRVFETAAVAPEDPSELV